MATSYPNWFSDPDESTNICVRAEDDPMKRAYKEFCVSAEQELYLRVQEDLLQSPKVSFKSLISYSVLKITILAPFSVRVHLF